MQTHAHTLTHTHTHTHTHTPLSLLPITPSTLTGLLSQKSPACRSCCRSPVSSAGRPARSPWRAARRCPWEPAACGCPWAGGPLWWPTGTWSSGPWPPPSGPGAPSSRCGWSRSPIPRGTCTSSPGRLSEPAHGGRADTQQHQCYHYNVTLCRFSLSLKSRLLGKSASLSQ